MSEESTSLCRHKPWMSCERGLPGHTCSRAPLSSDSSGSKARYKHAEAMSVQLLKRKGMEKDWDGCQPQLSELSRCILGELCQESPEKAKGRIKLPLPASSLADSYSGGTPVDSCDIA